MPGGSEGPSGVLICSENYITYKNFGDQPDIRCPIPRRRVSTVTLLCTVIHKANVSGSVVLDFMSALHCCNYVDRPILESTQIFCVHIFADTSYLSKLYHINNNFIAASLLLTVMKYVAE